MVSFFIIPCIVVGIHVKNMMGRIIELSFSASKERTKRFIIIFFSAMFSTRSTKTIIKQNALIDHGASFDVDFTIFE